jgi:hypothetical protein
MIGRKTSKHITGSFLIKVSILKHNQLSAEKIENIFAKEMAISTKNTAT